MNAINQQPEHKHPDNLPAPKAPSPPPHKSTRHGLTLLTLLLAVAGLGTLNLRQYHQIQQLRRSDTQQARFQTQANTQLACQLQRLQNRLRHNSSTIAPHSVTPGPLALATTRPAEHIVADLAPGVCLIQGEYIFLDPLSQQPIRQNHPQLAQTLSSTSGYPQDPDKAPDLPTNQPILKTQYTASGFLIDPRGYILTSKHVTSPWHTSGPDRCLLEQSYEPHLSLFRAFFPGHPQPVPLRVAARSPDQDIALLWADLTDLPAPVLPCQTDPNQIRPGQTVILIGYPTGFDALLARLEPAELAEISIGGDSFEQMAASMALADLIEPTVTRGICGRAHDRRLTYDAQTTIGGSGGPLLTLDGKVVAINTATLRGFAGTNFGIPIAHALDLLNHIDTPNTHDH